MARQLSTFPNVDNSDPVNYPYGRVKNNTGGNNGTPVNELTTGDWWQFFAVLLDAASFTPNGLPDNNTDGFQLFNALVAIIQLEILVTNATESAAGSAELATQAETNAGTDDARIVTPLKLAGAAGTWANVSTFGTGWVSAVSPQVVRYLKDGFKRVQIQGVAANNSFSTNTNITIFTLPVGFRPTNDLVIPVYIIIGSSGSISKVFISSSTGIVLFNDTGLSAQNVAIHLDSISFPAV